MTDVIDNNDYVTLSYVMILDNGVGISTNNLIPTHQKLSFLTFANYILETLNDYLTTLRTLRRICHHVLTSQKSQSQLRDRVPNSRTPY